MERGGQDVESSDDADPSLEPDPAVTTGAPRLVRDATAEGDPAVAAGEPPPDRDTTGESDPPVVPGASPPGRDTAGPPGTGGFAPRVRSAAGNRSDDDGPCPRPAPDRHWADADEVGPEVARAFGVVWDHLVPADDPAPADAVFCFGSRHRRVAAVAARLHLDGLAPWVLATGGPDDDPDGLAEGDRLAAELTGLGVAAERIVVERSARHTGENVLLGVRALTEVVAPRRLLLVSWPLAARRCRATLRAHHPDVEALAVPALPRPGVRWAPTWRRIGFALGELDRLDRYSRTGFLVAGEIPSAVADAAMILRSARAVHDGRELVGPRPRTASAR